jgi:dihydroorotase-like cyclic amidohydrolase
VDKKTKVEIEMKEYVLSKKDLRTKCGWSPFEGKRVVGKVKRVILHGKEVYKDGKLLVKKGSGKIITP